MTPPDDTKGLSGIDRLAYVVLDEIWGVKPDEMAPDQLENVISGDNGAALDLRAVVRSLLQAMREPGRELCEIGMEYTADPCWPEDVGRAFTAMIDHLLNENPSLHATEGEG